MQLSNACHHFHIRQSRAVDLTDMLQEGKMSCDQHWPIYIWKNEHFGGLISKPHNIFFNMILSFSRG